MNLILFIINFIIILLRLSLPGEVRKITAENMAAIVEMKRRNLRYGCRRIAMQISNAFGVEISKDVVRRVLNKHFMGSPSSNGPSWLTFIGHMKDSCWSMDFFRAESIHLKSH